MKIVRNTYFFLHNKAVFCKNIWSCQKKAVPLQPISKRDQVFLAQLVEQLTLNQWVQGSSPWEDTKGYPNGYPFLCSYADKNPRRKVSFLFLWHNSCISQKNIVTLRSN